MSGISSTFKTPVYFCSPCIYIYVILQYVDGIICGDDVYLRVKVDVVTTKPKGLLMMCGSSQRCWNPVPGLACKSEVLDVDALLAGRFIA